MISMAVITFVLAAIFTRGDKCFHSVKVKALGKLPGIAYSREYTVKMSKSAKCIPIQNAKRQTQEIN